MQLPQNGYFSRHSKQTKTFNTTSLRRSHPLPRTSK